jgi:tape measure domain-containing protein
MGLSLVVELDPSRANAGVKSIEQSLAELDRLATRTGQKMQEAFSKNIKGPSGGFGDLKAILSKNGAGEIEHLIAGFNKSAVAAANARGAYQSLGGSTSKLSGLTNALTGEVGQLALAYVSLGVAKQAAEAIVDMTDRYANLQNKIALVTHSQAEANQLISDLKGIANETGNSLESTAELYIRTKNAISGLGYGAATTKKFVEEISKVIAASGIDAQTAAAGMLQLSQGLSEGKLQGQNLKLLLSDVPQLGQAIADHLGVTIDKLRTLGEQGKIMSRDVVESFTHGTQAGEKFDDRIKTVGQAMQAAKNDLEVFVGQVVGSLGPSMDDVVHQFEDFLEAIKPAATVLAQFIVKVGAKEIISFAHFIESSAEAFGHQFEAIQSALGPLGKLIEKIGLLDNGLENYAKLMDMTINATHSLTDAARAGADAVALLNAQLAVEEAVAAKNQKVDEDRAKQNEIDHVRQMQYIRDHIKSEKNLQELYKDDIITKEEYQSLSNSLHKKDQSASKKAEDAERKHQEALEKALELADPVRKATVEQEKVFAALYELVDQGTISFQRAQEVMRVYDEENRRALDPIGELTAQLGEQRRMQSLSADQQAHLNAEREAENELLKRGIDLLSDSAKAYLSQVDAQVASTLAHDKNQKKLDELNAILSGINNGPIQEYEHHIKLLHELVTSGAISVDKYAEELKKAGEAFNEPLPTDKFTSFHDSLINGGNEIRDNLLNVGDDIAQAFSGAFDRGLDALTTFLTTGKLEFKQFAIESLQQIDKIIIKLLLLQAIKAFAGGSKAASFAKLLGFATGGSFMVGGHGGTDSQVVAFKATPREQVIVRTPGQQQAAARNENIGGGAPRVHIVNVDDQNRTFDDIESPRGERAILNVLRKNRGALKGL